MMRLKRTAASPAGQLMQHRRLYLQVPPRIQELPDLSYDSAAQDKYLLNPIVYQKVKVALAEPDLYVF